VGVSGGPMSSVSISFAKREEIRDRGTERGEEKLSTDFTDYTDSEKAERALVALPSVLFNL
jgi:hypothetical protein